MELLDIVDENDILTGEAMERDYVHDNNLFHRHASCWILNYKGEILLQRRALTKKKKPGVWSKTGGHAHKGETVEDAIKREVKEEIGLDISDNNLFFMQKFKSINPNFFSYGYIVLTDKKEEEFKLQTEELDKVEYFSIEYLEEQKRNKNNLFDFYYWEDDDFFSQMQKLKEFRDERL